MILSTIAMGHAAAQMGLDRTQIKQYEFDDTDYIRGEARRPAKESYFVGEPVIFDLRLFNHTRHPVTLRTNFIPNSNLKISITRFGYASTIPFDGGYGVGARHGQRVLEMLPQGMVEEKLIIWNDSTTPDHLVFSQPGEYIIRLSIHVEVLESQSMEGEVSLGEHRIKIVNTPNQFKEQVELFKKWGVFRDITTGFLPEEHLDDVEKILNDPKTYPVNTITPYLHFALGSQLARRWMATRNLKQISKAEKKRLIDRALLHLQISARSDSANQFLSYQSLLMLFDQLDNTQAAYQFCMQMLAEMPPSAVGTIGENELVDKYLIRGREMDPIKTWTLMP